VSVFYGICNVFCSSLAKNRNHIFCLEMKTNLLEGVDNRRGCRCTVTLQDRDKRQHWTDVGKNSFVNRTIKSWNQLPAGLVASFKCKINSLRKKVKNVVTTRYFQWGMIVNERSDVNCSDLEWNYVIFVKWFCFEVKWSEVSYFEVLKDKTTMYIMVTLYWKYLIVLWLFYLVFILYPIMWELKKSYFELISTGISHMK
jgi:hypothetical protein